MTPAQEAGGALTPFKKQYTALLTSHKRDGTGVGTPVNIAVDGDHAYVRTFGKAWKVKRMRNNPEVELAPSTVRGRPTGPEVKARVRRLDEGSEEFRHAARLIRRKYPVVHGVWVSLAHKVQRDKDVYYEVTAVTRPDAAPGNA
ncbi:PPOX class F420-dependent oxidoreductase [Streptomyces sp. NPDC091292]|uniref:PPOX class F420-dependent oxidoreductase n=1 Tax=Streptomyces sp. NPDC091292 TaxID=3365991 RepID=UPI0037F860D6